MRLRVGNPYREAHGRAMRVYDWIVPPQGVEPGGAHGRWAEAVAQEMRRATGLLLASGDGAAHGFLTTSLRPEGHLYLAVALYDAACEPTCPHHRGVRFVPAPILTPTEALRLVDVTTEAPDFRLGKHDGALLRALGFRDTADKRDGVLGPYRHHWTAAQLERHFAACVASECYTDAPLRAA
ncbi:MAG TPA: hypothetical protein VD948_12550 [Rhodothermales bacterium]|nr:hypothetical protein [Rhodothermales bacterium]